MQTKHMLPAICLAAMLAHGPASAQERSGSFSAQAVGSPARAFTGSSGLKYGSGNKAPKLATFAPLTKEECEGLGGHVVITLNCKGGLYTCSTIDSHGVVRSQCISK